ncbi:response regulator [Pelosinus sp. sgz500959]|uniref:response regulator n=1 Tax=Pelosinus sp. sgz500959 TaxID=3242472 RepID=UPI003671442D
MSKIKVLIVEDDPMVADINKRFTEAIAGFSVLGIATNGNHALKMLNELRPDLIILDIYMPEINGVEVLALLRKQEIPVDIILVTAANDSEVIGRIMRYGIIDYIIKPFKFERYRSTLENYRDFKNKLLQNDNFTQVELDALLLTKMARDDKKIPKNLHIQTLNSIMDLLRSTDTSQSADDIAVEMGISRVTVRRYLEYLVAEDKLEMVLEYLPVGRPTHRFKLK